MAQYYNLVADNGMPITVDNDGQRIQLVVQGLDNCVNGNTRIVTYRETVQGGQRVYRQVTSTGGGVGGGQLQTAVEQRQNVYIIKTDETSLAQSPLKTNPPPLTPHETTNYIITDSKNPNDPQVQWIAVQDSQKMSKPPKAATPSQGPSRRILKPKSKSPPPSQPLPPLHRIKNPPSKPSPRSPLHPDAKIPAKHLAAQNRGLQTLQNLPQVGFLSERIKQARMSGGKSSSAPPPAPPKVVQRPQNVVTAVRKQITPTQSPEISPHEMEVDVPQETPVNPDQDPDSQSIAYLQETITHPSQTIVQHQIIGNTAKMLVILPTGEQRLITFDIPNEDCTVQDLLEQANIPSNGETTVSLVKDPVLNINYIVESGEGVVMSDIDNTEPHDAESQFEPYEETSNSSSSASEQRKFVPNQLAVCPHCGCCSMDFNRCARCRTKLPEDVKTVAADPGNPSQLKKEALIPIDNFYPRKKGAEPPKDSKKTTKARIPRVPNNAKVKPTVECLTISSDEEDENPVKKQKKLENKVLQARAMLVQQSDEPDMISDKEPIITNSMEASSECLDPSRNGEEVNNEDINNLTTSLICRTVRIGSYKYVPEANAIVNNSGLVLQVPLLEDDKKTVTLHVKMHSIAKVLIHFGKAMPVLFFYTSIKMGEHIRGVLGMQDPIGPYYDPASKDQTHKRITLLPEKLSEESKAVIRQLFTQNNLFEELNSKEANDILVKASPKDNLQNPTNRRTSTTPAANGIVEKITVYPPPPAKGGIALNTEDYACLGEDQFLNDAIIDFYLKYLTLEVLSPEDQQRTHVFSSYFYKRLTSPGQSGDNPKMSAAAKRHARVQKWTKNVNVFEKDFIVIPINEHAHWFLAIICFPGLVGVVEPPKVVKQEKPEKKKKNSKDVKLQSMTIGSTTITPVQTTTITLDPGDDASERDEAEGDEDELEEDSDDEEEQVPKSEEGEKVKVKEEIKEEIKQEIKEEAPEVKKIPCILIFDSLAGPGRARVVATLRDYLSCEFVAKMGVEKEFSRDTIKGACPKVPQQSNFTDCGLYVLQYAEAFFENPVLDYTLPIKSLKNWFEEIVVTRKREELSKLVVKLMLASKGDRTINLPVVQFPTMDGKLRPRPEGEKKEEKVKKEEETKAEVKEPVVSEATPGKTTTFYTIVPMVAADGEYTVDKTKVAPGNAMSFLRTKRIPRLMMRDTSTPTSEVAAKKHKGDNNESCK